MSKLSLHHVSVIKCSQIRKRSRNANIIGASSLVNQYDLDHRTITLIYVKKKYQLVHNITNHW